MGDETKKTKRNEKEKISNYSIHRKKRGGGGEKSAHILVTTEVKSRCRPKAVARGSAAVRRRGVFPWEDEYELLVWLERRRNRDGG